MEMIIDTAVKYFCTKTLGFDITEGKKLGKDFYGASIPLYEHDTEYHFYLFFKKDTLKLFLKVFFDKDELELADMDDLCKEVSNQIIGKAKIILSESNGDHYKLGTPEFLGEVENFKIKLDKKLIYKIHNRTFQIGFKKV